MFDTKSSFLNSPLLTGTEKKKISFASDAALAKLLQSGGFVFSEDSYPEVLRQACDFVSPALFALGQTDSLFKPTVGIVGTRNATPYGKACAHKFAEALAKNGITIVSGGALGIDAAAHEGALAAGGATVAVLAGGVDWVYPSVHASLFRKIQERGCLLSQFAAGSRPNDYKFLARNVTIASLSQVLLVVQAPTRSGALSTAHAAAELGREVFVVPANIDAYDFRGSFNLIRDGATLVYHPDQIMEVLGVGGPGEDVAPETSEVGEAILAVLGLEPLDTDMISERTGLSASDILAEITMLELDGQVLRHSGGYVKTR